MDADKAVQNTNSTISAIFGLLKRTWFVALVLWCVLAVQVVGILTETHPLQVARDFLVETLSLTVSVPYFDWAEDHLVEPLRTQPGNTIASIFLVVLLVASFLSFARDSYTEKGTAGIGTVKSMTRFVVYTTFAAFVGGDEGLSWLIAALVLTAVAVGIAGAVTATTRSDWVEDFASALRDSAKEFGECVALFLLNFVSALIFPLAFVLVVILNAIG